MANPATIDICAIGADATFPYPTLGYVNKYAARQAQVALRNAWWKRPLAKLRRALG